MKTEQEIRDMISDLIENRKYYYEEYRKGNIPREVYRRILGI